MSYDIMNENKNFSKTSISQAQERTELENNIESFNLQA